MKTWVPVLEDGPEHWLDREWSWERLGEVELHVESNPEWLVIADEQEPEATGDLLGILVTTGPATTEGAGVDALLKRVGAMLWVEQIAIAPSLRADCPEAFRRKPRLKLIGQRLMRAAIARSEELGLGGCMRKAI